MDLKKLAMVCGLCMMMSAASAEEWTPDVLGGGFEQLTLEMPDDYSGRVVSTLVRKQAAENTGKVIFYLHGYNDYFFQSELGDSAVARGFGFYALDLRKYGRSIRPGQTRFETKSLKEYFEDLDSALSVIRREGADNIVLMAHSTGGLIMSYYLSEREGQCADVKAMILNSPFLDMNLSKFQEKFLVPLVSFLPFKKIKISQGNSRAYAESLLRRYHGEWEYDTDWKLEVSPEVTTGWITAIHKAQKYLHKHSDLKLPVLLMHSDKSVYGNVWTSEFNAGDAVLDVDDISKYGNKLGRNVTEVTIAGGLHDLLLSKKAVRNEVYRTMFAWLEELGL